jgi:hypothetical protein
MKRSLHQLSRRREILNLQSSKSHVARSSNRCTRRKTHLRTATLQICNQEVMSRRCVRPLCAPHHSIISSHRSTTMSINHHSTMMITMGRSLLRSNMAATKIDMIITLRWITKAHTTNITKRKHPSNTHPIVKYTSSHSRMPSSEISSLALLSRGRQVDPI